MMLDTKLTAQTAENIPNISQFGNMPASYAHHKRLVTPGADLMLPNAYLKWYDIQRINGSITPEMQQESRDFLVSQAESLDFKNELGFVMLHHCSTVVYLFVDVWRNHNELWKTIYYKYLVDGAVYQPYVFDSVLEPGFCVWELTAVWHEREAWNRYLSSRRDDAAKYAYLNDRYSGLY